MMQPPGHSLGSSSDLQLWQALQTHCRRQSLVVLRSTTDFLFSNRAARAGAQCLGRIVMGWVTFGIRLARSACGEVLLQQ